MNIYVANIHLEARENELKSLFDKYGEVVSVKIILDRETKKSRGFGFVVMKKDSEAKNAIQNINGSIFKGRSLAVKEALPPAKEVKDNSNHKSTNVTKERKDSVVKAPDINLDDIKNKSSEHKKKKDDRNFFESERKIKKSFDKKKKYRDFDEDDDDYNYRIKY
ncbi:MAG: RNA-binding protein [Chitinophagales bacterium]|nr:RNA-binding protein [Chitinophagales bacterium]